MNDDKKERVTWDTPTPEQIKEDFIAALMNDPSMCGILKFHGAFTSPQLVSEIPGHQGRINSQDYVFVQPKLDGHCCMANTRTRRIYSRSGREITTLPHINAGLVSEGPEWLHGELWKSGATADSVGAMIRTGDASLELHVFDCVHSDPFFLRYVEQIPVFSDGPIRNVDTMQIRPDEININYQVILALGYEGIIIRLDGHGYYHGRSQNVFKMKPGTEGV